MLLSRVATPVHVFAPIFEHLYRRVAEDVALGSGGSRPKPPAGDRFDLGCGPGDLVMAISRRLRDARIVGIDVSPSMLWAGRHATTDGRLRSLFADAPDLPFDDASVDLVVSTLSLHHWTEPSDAFAEIAPKLVQPGGVALIYDLDLLRPRRRRLPRSPPVRASGERVVRERVRGPLLSIFFVRFKLEGFE